MINVFIGPSWPSPKIECMYHHALETGSDVLAGIGRWTDYYSRQRSHSCLSLA
jgi:putative transposase